MQNMQNFLASIQSLPESKMMSAARVLQDGNAELFVVMKLQFGKKAPNTARDGASLTGKRDNVLASMA